MRERSSKPSSTINVHEFPVVDGTKKHLHVWSSAEWTMLCVAFCIVCLIIYMPTPSGNPAIERSRAEPHPFPLINPDLMEDHSVKLDPKRANGYVPEVDIISVKKIAWAVTVSKDGSFVDGAAVLMRGIQLTHPNPVSLDQNVKFEHEFVAICHPEVVNAKAALKSLGWIIFEHIEPVTAEEIEGDFLRSHILKSGCCGARELLKLYAWTLTSYWRVVHLDMDSLVLANMDELFLVDSSLIYTCDYNMMSEGSRKKLAMGDTSVVRACPVQGGFVIVRPNQRVFEEMCEIVRKGDFSSSGWGGTPIGAWWGGATFQGVVPYYYATAKASGIEVDGSAIEVDRCVYNNMVDKGVDHPLVGTQECRATPLQDIKNVHFTLCQKPWDCQPAHQKNDIHHLCMDLHRRWHAIRNDLEGRPIDNDPKNWSQGHCKAGKYIPLDINQVNKNIHTDKRGLSSIQLIEHDLTDPEEQTDHHALTSSSSLKSVAWAITVSADGPFVDGAAVVMESILRTHPDGHGGFSHHFVAFVHPNATKSVKPLKDLGFDVIVRDSPVLQHEIKTAFFRKHSVKSGCCGLSELIKLYAWTLTSYWRVVHLDMDSLVLANMDELFLMDSSLIYTCDYNMMSAPTRAKPDKVCPVQGGFVVIKPDMIPFRAMVDIVREGRFGAGAGPGKSGWNGTGIGHWWGGATFQGIVPFYYYQVANKALFEAVEVDRCIYDNMVDDPVPHPRVGGENCRATPLQDIKNVHFTLCQKPWKCSPPNYPDDHQKLCLALHSKWFDLRLSAESRLGIPSAPIGNGANKFHKGGCAYGRYVPMAFTEHKN